MTLKTIQVLYFYFGLIAIKQVIGKIDNCFDKSEAKDTIEDYFENASNGDDSDDSDDTSDDSSDSSNSDTVNKIKQVVDYYGGDFGFASTDTKLCNKGKGSYHKSFPSGLPNATEVSSRCIVFDITSMDEGEYTMTLSVSIILTWNDSRLSIEKQNVTG